MSSLVHWSDLLKAVAREVQEHPDLVRHATSIGQKLLGAAGSKLATKVVELGMKGASALFSDPEDRKAIRAASRKALGAMAAAMTPRETWTEDGLVHARDIIERFVSEPEIAELLVQMALELPFTRYPRESWQLLRAKFLTAGFDERTMPCSFGAAMVTYVTAFNRELSREAIRPGSPLTARVSQAERRVIHRKTMMAIGHLSRQVAHVDRRLGLVQRELRGFRKAVMKELAPTSRRLDAEALREYLEIVREAYRELPYQHLWGELPSDLDTLYVQRVQEPGAGTEQLTTGPATIMQILAKHVHVLLEGDPGLGKTTLLRHLAMDLSRRILGGEANLPVPVLVTARALVSFQGRLESCLWEALKAELDKMSPEWPNPFRGRPYPDRAWLIMIDALDEVSGADRQRLLTTLKYQITRPGSPLRFLATTRPLAQMAAPPEFARYTLRPLHLDQLNKFASNWFRTQDSLAGKAAEFVQQVEQSRIADLARNPLLLTMAAVVFEETGGTLPQYRTDLYYRFLVKLLAARGDQTTRNSLAAAWEAAYPGAGSTVLGQLFQSQNRLALLEYLAQWYDQGRPGKLLSEAMNYLGPMLPNLVDVTWLAPQVESLLQSTGIICRQGDDLKFIHATLGQYLAARAYARSCKPEDARARDLIIRWSEPDGRETLLFLLRLWSVDGTDVTALLRPVFQEGGTGLLFVAAAVAEGAKVSEEFRAAMVDALLSQSRQPPVLSATAALNALVRLGGQTAITCLSSLVGDDAVWAAQRIAAARALHGLGQGSAARTPLLAIARNPLELLTDRIGAAHLAARLGEREAPGVLAKILDGLDEDRYDYVRQLAELLLELGDRDAARQLAISSLSNPSAPVTHHIWGITTFLKGEYPSLAKDRLTRIALRELTAQDEAGIAAAVELAQMGEVGVVTGVLRVFALASTDFRFRLGAANALTKLGALAEAQECLRHLMEAPNVRPENQIEVALALNAAGEATEAEAKLVSLAQPGKVPWVFQASLAQALAQVGRIDLAERVALQRAGDKADADERISAIQLLERMGRSRLAQQLYLRILQDNDLLWHQRMEVLNGLANLQPAVISVATLCELLLTVGCEPELYWESWPALQAFAAQAAPRLEGSGGSEASQEHRRAAVRNAGVLYAFAGQLISARRNLEQAVALTPQDGIVWARLGKVLADLAVPGEATSAFLRAIELGGDSNWTRLHLAIQMIELGDLRSAEEHLLTTKDCGEALIYLGVLAWVRGETGLAHQYWNGTMIGSELHFADSSQLLAILSLGAGEEEEAHRGMYTAWTLYGSRAFNSTLWHLLKQSPFPMPGIDRILPMVAPQEAIIQ